LRGTRTAENCEPRRANIDSEFCFNSYHATTEKDDFPGDWNSGQEGTSLQSAMQEWRRRGVISSFAFSYSVEEVVAWVLGRGPVCIGVQWFSGMHDPTEENNWFIEPTGNPLPGTPSPYRVSTGAWGTTTAWCSTSTRSKSSTWWICRRRRSGSRAIGTTGRGSPSRIFLAAASRPIGGIRQGE
jgi:hypothetical protein